MRPHTTLLIVTLLFNLLACEHDHGDKEGIDEHYSNPRHGQFQNLFGDLSNKIIAEIGAGLGYDAIPMARLAKRVIAIDIDTASVIRLDSIAGADTTLNLEARLTAHDTPGLRPAEADGVLMVDTYMFISDRPAYLERLSKGMKVRGKLVIVDFKKKTTRFGPDVNYRVPVYEVEQELKKAGYFVEEINDTSLENRYIVVAINQ